MKKGSGLYLPLFLPLKKGISPPIKHPHQYTAAVAVGFV
jgi:hypothetical protein